MATFTHRYETGIDSVDASKQSATVSKAVKIEDIQKELFKVYNGDMLSIGQGIDFIQEFLGADNFERNFGFDADLRPGQTLNVSYELDVIGSLKKSEDATCTATYQTLKGEMDSIKAGGFYEYGVEDCTLCPAGTECGKDLVDLGMLTNRSQKANASYAKSKLYAFFTGKGLDGTNITAGTFAPISSLGKETTNTTALNYVEQINLTLGDIEEAVHANMFSADPKKWIQARSLDSQLKILISHKELRYMQLYPNAYLEWLPASISAGFGVRQAGIWDGRFPVYSVPAEFINSKPWMIVDTGSLFWKEMCGLEKFFPKGHNSDKPRLSRYYKSVVFMNFQMPSLGDYSVYGKDIAKPQFESYATKTKAVS